MYLQFDFKPLCWCAISPFHAKWANYADEFIHFVPLEVSRCVIKSSIVGLLWWFQLPTLLYWIELWSILVFILPDWSKQFQSCFLWVFIHEDFIPVDLYQHHQVAPFQKYLTVTDRCFMRFFPTHQFLIADPCFAKNSTFRYRSWQYCACARDATSSVLPRCIKIKHFFYQFRKLIHSWIWQAKC